MRAFVHSRLPERLILALLVMCIAVLVLAAIFIGSEFALALFADSGWWLLIGLVGYLFSLTVRKRSEQAAESYQGSLEKLECDW